MRLTAKNTTPKERIDLGSIPEPMSGCWLWEGRTVKGYGVFGWDGSPTYAHRFSWTTYVGEIPDGLCVLHRCDNTFCVNPEHLFLGDRPANNKDRHEKGRFARQQGSQHGRSKLTEDEARQIQKSTLPGSELMELYGISKAQVSAIRTRRGWKHL